MSTSPNNITPSISLTTPILTTPILTTPFQSPNNSLIHQNILTTPITTSPISPIQTIPIITPLQPQYIINPSITPTTPIIVVPNINLISKPNNNAKIKAILEKKRTSPLTNEETKILEAAVASARQQFLCWYQQQAIRQRVALNLVNPIQLQQLQLLQQSQTQLTATQILTPKQIGIIQQQQQLFQTLHYTQQAQAAQVAQVQLQLQQQQLLQQQMANNLYNNNMYNSNSNSSTNSKEIPMDVSTYFQLPKPEEFDEIFYENEDGKDKYNELIELFTDRYEEKKVNDICFNIELDGIGVFEYGNDEVKDKYKKIETSKTKRQSVYDVFGVEDNTNECCQWLIRDLMRSQSEFKSHSNFKLNKDCEIIFTNVENKQRENKNINEKVMNRIINKINSCPHIPRALFQSDLYYLYELYQYKIIEISHVDMYRANIKIINKCAEHTNPCHKNKNKNNILSYNNIINKSDNITLEFFNLCIYMQENFDPCTDVETRTDYTYSDEKLYEIAIKLRNNPNYFNIPTLPSNSCQSPTKSPNNISVTSPNYIPKHINNINNINNLNVTNRIINIGNVTITPNQYNNIANTNINNSTPTYIYPSYTPTAFTYPTVTIPNTYIPHVIPQNIINQNAFINNTQITQIQSPTKPIKIPNATSWNVGGL